MDTLKDTKMPPAKDAVIDTLRKMQATAWVYEDMLGRKCVGFERPLHRRNTHEPLFSAANHAVIMGLINLLDAAEKKRDAAIELLDKAKSALRQHHKSAMCEGCDHSHPLTQLRLSAYQQSKLYADTVSVLEKSK